MLNNEHDKATDKIRFPLTFRKSIRERISDTSCKLNLRRVTNANIVELARGTASEIDIVTKGGNTEWLAVASSRQIKTAQNTVLDKDMTDRFENALGKKQIVCLEERDESFAWHCSSEDIFNTTS